MRSQVRSLLLRPYMEDDAVALVPRLALKTRFSEMGWGSTPPSSAKIVCLGSLMVERHPYTVDTGVRFSNEVPNIAKIAQ